MGRTACVVWLFCVWGWYRAAPEPPSPGPPVCRAGLPASTPAPVPQPVFPMPGAGAALLLRGPCLEPGSFSDLPRPRQLLFWAGSVCLTLSSAPCPASCRVPPRTSSLTRRRLSCRALSCWRRGLPPFRPGRAPRSQQAARL